MTGARTEAEQPDPRMMCMKNACVKCSFRTSANTIAFFMVTWKVTAEGVSAHRPYYIVLGVKAAGDHCSDSWIISVS